MAEEERLTKAERRKRKREERQREQQREARRRLRRRIITGVSTVAVLALVGSVVWQAFFATGDELGETVTLTAAEVTEARSGAGCEVVDQRTDFNRQHFTSEQAAPAPDGIYAVRPSHGGPHVESPLPLVSSSDDQLPEVTTTHNLEHGALIVWYDPEQVPAGTVGEIEQWSERLNESGFANTRGGAGIFVAPYTDPGIPGDAAVAMRGWGIAIDCDQWSRTAADGFVLQYFGTHGIAPEAPTLGPYPEGTIAWEGEPLDNGFGAGDGGESRTGATSPPTDGPTGTPAPGDG